MLTLTAIDYAAARLLLGQQVIMNKLSTAECSYSAGRMQWGDGGCSGCGGGGYGDL